MSFLKNNGLRGSDLDLEIEQIQVSAGSSAAATTLEQSRIRSDYGVIVRAAIKPAGYTNFNPAGNTCQPLSRTPSSVSTCTSCT